jgi:dipeptidyl aminopeptidase/acylaminoacyl peptidase
MNPSSRPGVQPDDLFRLHLVTDGRLAPDGDAVAYEVKHLDSESHSECAAIFLHNLRDHSTRQLTAGIALDTSPIWSPDGRQIAFLSTRSGKAQIHLIDVNGGEARRLTNLAQGVSGGIAWSPDGGQIAFTARPTAETPDATKPYRITRPMYRFDELGYVDWGVQELFVIDAQSGESRQITHDLGVNSAPAWSPDGNELLYLSALSPHRYRLLPSVCVTTLDGDSRAVVDAWGNAIAAAWLPDGEHIAFAGFPAGQPIGTQEQLWVVDSHGKSEPVCRSAGFDFKVCGGLQADMAVRSVVRAPRLFVSEDGEWAYAHVQAGGTVQAMRFALNGQQPNDVVADGERSCLLLDARRGRTLHLVSTLHDPAQLTMKEGAVERRLTRLNEALLAGWDHPQVERLLFSSSDDQAVEGWIMLPEGRDAPHPTVLYIHGGPHSGFGHIFSFDFRMLCSAGYAILFINQRGSTGYGDRFATQIKGDWGNLDYADLMAGVDHAIGLGRCDPDRLGVCGLSGGGNLTCWIIGHTDRFKAAVPENPVINWVSFYGVSDIGPWFAVEELGGAPHEIPEVYARCSPITYAHRCRTPTLLIQGESDWRCPAEQSEQFYTVLKANGCVVEMVRLPGSPHGGAITGPEAVRRAQNEALLEWMQRWV